MTYSMYDEIGRGDSGTMSQALKFDEEVGGVKDMGPRPQLGCCMKVGSIYARSYQHQDWWMTTPIVEILEDTPNLVKFKTKTGSIYTWKTL